MRELLSDARLLVWDFGCCRSSACVGLDTRRALARLSLLVTLARKHLCGAFDETEGSVRTAR
jgi:hypothetical protein